MTQRRKARTISIVRLVHLIILVAGIFNCRGLFGKSYYVSTDGDDSKAGTLGFPWANLYYAVTVASAGDTIFMRGGTYSTDEVWIRKSRGMGGADGQYLTIKNFPGETVSVGGIRLFIIDADYVRIEGLNFRLPYNVVGGGKGFQLVNNSFNGPQPRYGVIEFFADNGLIEGNRIEVTSDGHSTDHGIYVHAGQNNVVRNNLVSGMSGYGLQLYDQGKPFEGLLIENNVITNSRTRGGIVIAPDAGSVAHDIIIRKNLIANNIFNGIRLRYNTYNVQIYNNTFYGNGIDANDVDDASAISVRDAAVHDVAFKNNIIEMSRTGAYHIQNRDGAGNITAERNLYWGTEAPRFKEVIDSSPIYGDPWFANPAGNDFHLASLSLAIDAGLEMGLPFHGDAPDLGAIEFGLPGVSIEPIFHDFGMVEVGLDSTRMMRVSNLGSEGLEIVKVDFFGTNADEFSLENGDKAFALPPGASQDLPVRFAPANAETKSAILQIKFIGLAQDSILNVSLIGSGDPGPVPEMALNVSALDYGDIEIGKPLSATLQIKNRGARDLTVGAASIFGPDSTQFSINDGVAPFVIAPGDSQHLTLSFHPVSLGSKNATLLLESNDWDSPFLNVSLSGNGIAVRVPDISASSMSHDFGSVNLGDSLSYTFQILNAGEKSLECYSSQLLGTDSTEFSIAQGGAPFTLNPGERRDVVVNFHPTSHGTKSSVLRLESNDPNKGSLYFSVIGQGTMITEVNDNSNSLPQNFGLKQNYPNPFNPETSIQYEVPIASEISIRIYDVNGRELIELVNAQKQPGVHTITWQGRNTLGREVASGLYFYKIDAIGKNGRQPLFSKTKQMIVLR